VISTNTYLLLGEVAVGEEGVDHDAGGCASRVRQLVVNDQRLAHGQVDEDACSADGLGSVDDQ